MSPVVRAAQARLTVTPNAAMTTLASPTLGGTEQLSVWRVAMVAGSAGPLHVADAEQVLTVVDGRVRVTLDDVALDLDRGDAVVLPAGSARRIEAPEAVELLVAGVARVAVSVPGEPTGRGTPPWIA